MNSTNYKSSRVASPNGYVTMPSGLNGQLFGTKLDQSTTPSIPSTNQHVHQQNNESLRFDPFLRLKIEKLESAMKFLGLQPTPEQQVEMRRRLRVDTDDTVAYRDFVALAQEMFTNDLQKINFTMPSARNETEKTLSHVSSRSVNTTVSEAELKFVSRERDKAKVENGRLQAALLQKDLVLRSTEDELLRVREELQNAMEEGRSLRSRLHLAEEAQKAARKTEEDYEEVLRMLETELLQARQKEVRQKMPDDHARLTELEYTLRKTEVDKKMYEAATERLLRFTTTVGENLTGVLRTITKEAEAIKGQSNDLTQMLPHSTQSVKMLAAEARSTTKAVRSLLEMESMSNGVEPTNQEKQKKLHSSSVPQN